MKLNGIDLNKLQVFCAVVEKSGYRGASERLGLTRSAISQAITSLETQLGRKLFLRQGIRILPTEEALRFYEEVRKYQQGLESALDRLQEREMSESGVLRIGAYEEFTKRKLLPIVETFLASHPRARLQFSFDSPSRLESLLESDRIDFSISIYPHRRRGIESEKIYQEELCLIAKKGLVPETFSLLDLAKLPIVDYYPSHLLFKRWWAVHSRKAPPQLNIRAFAATADMVLEMVGKGIGIGVVPKYMLNGASQRIQVIAPSKRKLVDHLWLNRKRENRTRKLDQAFAKEITRLEP